MRREEDDRQTRELRADVIEEREAVHAGHADVAEDEIPWPRVELLHLQLAADQARRIAGIVDRYDRMGRVEPRKTTVRVNEVAQRIARAHGVSDVKFAGGDPECDADRELIESALENVVRNAVEATGTADAVLIETDVDVPGRAILLRVVDRGPGLDPRQLERAFEDFFTTKPEGTGLGLPFVRRVLLAHGGDVSMTSSGKGTTVELRLPTG